MKKNLALHTNAEADALRRGDDVGLDAAHQRAWGALLRSHASFIERIGKRLSTQNAVSVEEYDVLLMLSYAPNQRLRMGELYEVVTLSRSGLTRLVDRLEREGWVKREVYSHDRRSFEAILTEAGEAERARNWPIHAQAIAEEFSGFFSVKEADVLADLLERPVKNTLVACDGTPNAPPL